MKKFLLLVLLLPTFVLAQATSTPAIRELPILQNIVDTDRRPEIVVTKDGDATLRNLKIVQIAGTTLFTRVSWDNMFLRLTVKTNQKTKFFRRYGEPTTRAELKEGDYLNIDGVLEPGGSAFTLIASNVVDLAVLKETSAFSGSVTTVLSDQNAFMLRTKRYGDVRVNVGTTTINKGTLSVSTAWLQPGDIVLSATGEYNHADKTLAATAIRVFVNLSQFKGRNYTGTLIAIQNPTSLVLQSEGKQYTVLLSTATVFKNKVRNVMPLKRFVEGDNVILYGATSESATTTITAEIVRNLSL